MSYPPPPAPLLGPPSGYTSGKSLPSAVVQHAVAVLNDSSFQYGDTDVQSYNGVDYIHRVEPHYDDHVGGVLKWHRGVSVFQPVGLAPSGGGSGGAGGAGQATPSGSGGQRGTSNVGSQGTPLKMVDIVPGEVYADEPPSMVWPGLFGVMIGWFSYRLWQGK